MSQAIRRYAGFSLIELMVAVAIVGILAAVALPSYMDSVKTGKRAEGRAALLQAAQAEERYLTVNNTYTSDLTAAGYKAYSGDTLAGSAYTLAVAAGSSGTLVSSYKIIATPTANLDDPQCSELTINNTGQKGMQGGTWTASRCW